MSYMRGRGLIGGAAPVRSSVAAHQAALPGVLASHSHRLEHQRRSPNRVHERTFPGVSGIGTYALAFEGDRQGNSLQLASQNSASLGCMKVSTW